MSDPNGYPVDLTEQQTVDRKAIAQELAARVRAEDHLALARDGAPSPREEALMNAVAEQGGQNG